MCTSVLLISLTILINFAKFECRPMREDEKTCLKDSNASIEMIFNYRPGHDVPPQELLCFVKCIFTKRDLITPDGVVAVETLRNLGLVKGDEPQKEKIYNCLEAGPKITSCMDLLPLEKCFTDQRINEP